MSIIAVQDLSKTYQQQSVLSHLNFDVKPGSVIGLLGRNGAGKSTLLECILGLRENQTGSIRLFGEDIRDLSQTSKAKIGFVPQTSEIFEWMTVGQLSDYMSRFYTTWNQTKVDHLIAQWDLDKNKVISKLSVGQKQRVSIIRALAHEPELLILDEPVASLDPAARREFLQELMEIVADQQTTIVFSTHIFSDLERIALDVALLHDGRIVLQQGLDELLDKTLCLRADAQELRTFLQQNSGQTILQSRELSAQQHQALVQVQGDFQTTLIPTSIQFEKLNLEDLFIALTNNKYQA